MQIERNLKIPLRSMIERIVEAKEEFTSSEVLVDKDKGQRKRDQEFTSKNKEEDKAPELPVDAEPMESVSTIKTVLAKRLDLVV